MGFSSIKNTGADDVLRSRLEKGPCAPVRIVSYDDAGATATLLADGPLGPGGTQVRLVQGPCQGLKLADLASGRPPARDGGNPVPATAPGEAVVFEHALARDGVLMVGKVATRMHDGMAGKVQMARMFARPTRASVSKRGPTQFVTLTDPTKARVVKDAAGFAEFVARELTSPWPGGLHGVLLRAGGECREIMADSDDRGWVESTEKFAARLGADGLFGGSPVEVIPLWTLPVGKEQFSRDANPFKLTEGPVYGPFTSLYNKGFLPSMAIIADEEVWAFGGKTGRTARTLVGLHPLRTDLRLRPENLPTPATSKVAVTPMRLFYRSEAEVDEAAAARARRRGTAPSAPARQTVTPAASVAPAGSGVARRGFGGMAARIADQPSTDAGDTPRAEAPRQVPSTARPVVGKAMFGRVMPRSRAPEPVPEDEPSPSPGF